MTHPPGVIWLCILCVKSKLKGEVFKLLGILVTVIAAKKLQMFQSSRPRPDPPFVLRPSIQYQRALHRLLASIIHPVQTGGFLGTPGGAGLAHPPT